MAKKQYISIKDFSLDFIDTVSSLVMNTSDAFLNGTPTSIYSDENSVKQIDTTITSGAKAATDAVNLVNQAANTDWKAVGEDALNFAQKLPLILTELTTVTVLNVTKELTNYTTKKIDTILDPTSVTNAVTYYSTYYMQLGIASSKELLSYLLTKHDLELQSNMDSANQDKVAYKIAYLQEKIAYIKQKTTYVVSDIKEGIKFVTPFIKRGPQILCNVANSYIDYGVNIAESYIDYGAKYVISYRDALIESIGEYLGAEMSKSINNTAKKLLSKELEDKKIEANIKLYKAINVMMSAAQIVIAQLGPQLGKLVKTGVQKGAKELVKKIPL